MMQALGNLAENAAKYSPAASAIRLEGSSTPGRVFLAVANEGATIAEADLPHVFERFYRGGSARGQEGGGLGLALVKAIAEGAGGSVAARSNEGTTVFTISLPMAGAPS
jgi:two-component system sensor histidine kinase MprB